MKEGQGRVNIFEETMAHMTYIQIEEAAREGTIVLFPVGVIEEHGPHLPLAVDVYGFYLQSRVVKSELGKKGIKSLIAPPFYWGINMATGSFSGWYYNPELVTLEVWRTLKPTNLTIKDLQVWRKGGMEARKITPQGYFGDPTTANPQRGKEEIEAYGRIAAEVIEAFLQGHYSPPKDPDI